MEENKTNIIDSTEIPIMTPKEADEYKEPEILEDTKEGGL
jgi:hypothetical protein